MTTIPIERLTTGTLLYIPAIHIRGLITKCDDFGTVEEIADDGEGYLLTLAFGIDCIEQHYVPYGETVQFGGRGEPKLRAEADVSFEEWRGKADAIGADIDRTIGEINKAQGHVCREIDERPLVAAVADALGVPALRAAE